MKLHDFLDNDEQYQHQLIWELGRHIETLNANGHTYLLYALNDFFVEIIYDSTLNKIIGKNQFKTGQELDKYI